MNLIYMLDEDNLASDAIRGFFGGICRFIYQAIGSVNDIINVVANRENLGINGDYIENLSSKIFFILIIYMLFKLTVSFLTYLVSPDTFADKNKGAANIIKRVIISIVLLVSINPIFNILFDVQGDILKSDVIANIILGSTDDYYYENDKGEQIYLTQISDACKSQYSDYRAITTTSGEHIALLTLKPFIQLNTTDDISDLVGDSNYCGYKIKHKGDTIVFEANTEQVEGSDINITLPQDTYGTDFYLSPSIYNRKTDSPLELNMWEHNYYMIDFNYFFALVVGAVVLLLFLSLSFDVVVRAFTLLLLQIIAPIPIINYVTPGSKGNEMLSGWGKKLLSTWASLFIRYAVITFAVSIISTVCNSDILGTNKFGLFTQIIIIIGVLIFAKKLPKLLEELFPGLKMSGGTFTLNPFKKIESEALGGKQINGAIMGGATALATGALLSPGANLANNIKKRKSLKAEEKTPWATAKRTGLALSRGVAYGTYNGLRTGYGAGKAGKFNIVRESVNATQKASEDRNLNEALIKQGVVGPGPFAQTRYMAHDKFTDVIGYQGSSGTTDEMKDHINALNAARAVSESKNRQATESLSRIESQSSAKFREARLNNSALKREYVMENGHAKLNKDGGIEWDRKNLLTYDDFVTKNQSFVKSMNPTELATFKREYEAYRQAEIDFQESYNEVLAINKQETKLTKQKDKFEAAKKKAANK